MTAEIKIVANATTGRFVSAAELQRMKFPEPKWAISGLVPEGFTILAGKPKIGKSWLVLGYAISIATGGQALRSIPVEQGEVIYYALEDSEKRLQRRLSIMLKECNDWPAKLHLKTRLPLLTAGGEQQIRKDIAEHPGTRLVIIDTLQKIRGHVDSRNPYAADYEVGTLLKRIADDCETPLLGVHHERKASSDDFVDSVSGTTGLTGAADTIITLSRERINADAVQRITGRDVEEAELALQFTKANGSWQLLGDATELRLTKERQDIIETLREAKEPLQPHQVAKALEKSSEAIRQMMTRMAKAGEIKSTGYGKYTTCHTSHGSHTADITNGKDNGIDEGEV
jgi:RecA-family ATPase